MQPTECGVVSLAIVLASKGLWVPIAEMRHRSGLDGNGLTIGAIARLAQHYGLEPHVYRATPETITARTMPVIGWWQRRHFLVIEGRGRDGWYVNDPEGGHRLVSDEEFEENFSGMLIELRKTEAFEPGGHPPRLFRSLRRILAGGGSGLVAVIVASIALVPLHLAMAGYLTYFVDRVLEHPTKEILRPFLLAVGVTVVLRSVISFIHSQTMLRMKTAAGLRMEVGLLDKTLRLSERELTLRLPGDIQQRLALAKGVASQAIGAFTMLPASLLSVFVFGGAVFLISPIVGVGVVIATFAGLGIVKSVNRLLYELNLKTQVALATQRSTMYAGLSSQAWLVESGTVGGFLDRWTSQLALARNLSQRKSRASLLASSGRSLISKLVSQVATLVFGGLGVIAGSITIGELAALQLLVGHAEGALGSLIGLAQSVPGMRASVNRLEDILLCPDRRDDGIEAGPSPEGPTGLLVDGLDVGRDGTVSGTAPLGEITFITGGSEREIPRLAKRLGGRLDGPGTVRWNRATDDSSPPSVRIVLGHCPLFPGSYAENLSNFDPTADIGRIWSALETTGLATRFRTIPGGLNAQVNQGDGFASGEDRFRLELSTVLCDVPELVIIAGGLSTVPPEDSTTLLDRLVEGGATVVILEPDIEPLPGRPRLVVEPPKEGAR